MHTATCFPGSASLVMSRFNSLVSTWTTWSRTSSYKDPRLKTKPWASWLNEHWIRPTPLWSALSNLRSPWGTWLKRLTPLVEDFHASTSLISLWSILSKSSKYAQLTTFLMLRIWNCSLMPRGTETTHSWAMVVSTLTSWWRRPCWIILKFSRSLTQPYQHLLVPTWLISVIKLQ